MEEQLISFKTVKLAKEKGFDIYKDSYSANGKEVILFKEQVYKIEDCKYPVPTQSLLQKWLREIHNVDISIIYWEQGYLYAVEPRPHKGNHYKVEYYNTYEEALEKGLQKALKLI